MRDPALLRRHPAEPKQEVRVPTTRSGLPPEGCVLVTLEAVRAFASPHEAIEFRSIDPPGSEQAGPERAIVASNWAGLPG